MSSRRSSTSRKRPWGRRSARVCSTRRPRTAVCRNGKGRESPASSSPCLAVRRVARSGRQRGSHPRDAGHSTKCEVRQNVKMCPAESSSKVMNLLREWSGPILELLDHSWPLLDSHLGPLPRVPKSKEKSTGNEYSSRARQSELRPELSGSAHCNPMRSPLGSDMSPSSKRTVWATTQIGATNVEEDVGCMLGAGANPPQNPREVDQEVRTGARKQVERKSGRSWPHRALS